MAQLGLCKDQHYQLSVPASCGL